MTTKTIQIGDLVKNKKTENITRFTHLVRLNGGEPKVILQGIKAMKWSTFEKNYTRLLNEHFGVSEMVDG
jgi:hypothetical protein